MPLLDPFNDRSRCSQLDVLVFAEDVFVPAEDHPAALAGGGALEGELEAAAELAGELEAAAAREEDEGGGDVGLAVDGLDAQDAGPLGLQGTSAAAQGVDAAGVEERRIGGGGRQGGALGDAVGGDELTEAPDEVVRDLLPLRLGLDAATPQHGFVGCVHR